jgi:hypothetical protein
VNKRLLIFIGVFVMGAAASSHAMNVKPGDRVLAGCYGNTKEALIERLDGARAWVRFSPEDRSCDGWREASQLKAAPVVAGTRGANYPVGAPVEVLSLGRWHSAVIREVRGNQYRVHLEHYTGDEWADKGNVRQTPQRARQKAGFAGPIPSGKYSCFNSSGGSLRHQADLVITGGSSYRGGSGGAGSYSKDQNGIVRFSGGAFNGTQGDFQHTDGRPFIYMHVPSKPGVRAGMDCEGPGGGS